MRSSWEFMPEMVGHTPRIPRSWDRYGRVGLEFYKAPWKPQIFLGFYLNPDDHAIPHVNAARGIDLVLFIEGEPAVVPMGLAWKQRADALRRQFPNLRVLEPHEIGRNKWRKLTIQEPLANVILQHPTEDEQVTFILERFRSWSTVLFADGQLEADMTSTWSSATGMVAS